MFCHVKACQLCCMDFFFFNLKASTSLKSVSRICWDTIIMGGIGRSVLILILGFLKSHAGRERDGGVGGLGVDVLES